MSLDSKSVETYLHEHIPLSKAMAVSVVSLAGDKVILSAPLPPNINHRRTAFGGSISTIATLAAWTFVHVQLQALPDPYRIVIQSHRIDYLKPIYGAFEAHCSSPPEADWSRFLKLLQRRGKGRIYLEAEVYSEGVLAGRFEGQYVAIAQESTQ